MVTSLSCAAAAAARSQLHHASDFPFEEGIDCFPDGAIVVGVVAHVLQLRQRFGSTQQPQCV